MANPEVTPAAQSAIAEANKRIGDCTRRRSTVLDLSGLHLTCLPPRILQLEKLTELDLSHNQLATLPAELSQFAQLARLDLSHNPLAAIPPEIHRLARLTRLDICHTPLATLPAELGGLTELTRLYLTHNRLVTLPPELGQLANLTRLYLSHNSLADVPPELGQLEKLTRLDLSHNRLATLPQQIGQFAKLTVLDLSDNPLGNLPPQIGDLAKLTVLHLSNDRLENLPAEIGKLSSLAELDLTNNRLTALPDSLRDLEHLERLFLHDNPALQLSPSLLGPHPAKTTDRRFAPPKSILDFYFGRQAGTTRPINEVKLVLLGRSGAGKTTIAQALRDLPFREREASTPGVALSDGLLDCGGDQPVTVHLWDFSGDPVTHLLHSFFISPRNLYVVVLTGRDHHEREDAEYWLRLIQSSATDEQGREPPVIVALNQWNVPGCRPELDRGALREKFPFIRGFVEMDCKVKKGIPALKAALCRELERMPWVREPIPENWEAVRHALAAGTMRAHLTHAEYRALCVEHGVTDEGQQDYLTEILHHLGVALNFRNDPRLHDATVLRPEWLVKHLYQLPYRAVKQAGILRQADLDAAFLTEKDESARACLMRMLELFGIACAGQAGSGPVWLLPHAQSGTAPADVVAFGTAEDALRLRFTYQISPERLLRQFIVRRFDFIEELREQKRQWRNGVIIARKGARALIRLEPELGQLTITVTGPVKTRNQLADLCTAEIQDLDAGIHGLCPVVTPEESSDAAR